MSLKDEFRTALKSNTHLDGLMELVDSHLAQGTQLREASRILYELWLELGFDEVNRPGSMQESLECVLEKVSDDCPFTG